MTTATASRTTGTAAAKPLLSVILPTFDGEAFLGHALDSVVDEAARHDPDLLDVVVVDDRSTDGSVELARSYTDRLPLRILRREGPRGWVAGTNEGLAAAEGRFACFLHQDDAWLPGRLDAFLHHLDRDPRLDLSLSAARFIDADDRPVGRWRCPLPATDALDPAMLFERLLVQNFIAIPAPIFRLDPTARLDEALWYTADWDFWLRRASLGARIAYDAEPRVVFRIHPNSQTVSRSVAAGDFRRQLETPLARHLPRAAHSATSRAARFSVEINLALAARAHGQPVDLGRLAVAGLKLGPGGLGRVLRDARLVERIVPRLRLLRRAAHSR
ncbi:MAG: glycosyltransferase [Acidobacteriota bacterium]